MAPTHGPHDGAECDRDVGGSPRAGKIAPFVVWLCTDAAQGVTGCTFLLVGDRVSLLAEPRPKRSIEQVGGWTLDDLDRAAPEELVPGMVNRWALADHPDLQIFPDEGR